MSTNRPGGGDHAKNDVIQRRKVQISSHENEYEWRLYKPELIYYISYYDRNWKRRFEKAGREGKDDMTAYRAILLRDKKIQ